MNVKIGTSMTVVGFKNKLNFEQLKSLDAVRFGCVDVIMADIPESVLSESCHPKNRGERRRAARELKAKQSVEKWREENRRALLLSSNRSQSSTQNDIVAESGVPIRHHQETEAERLLFESVNEPSTGGLVRQQFPSNRGSLGRVLPWRAYNNFALEPIGLPKLPRT